MIVSGSFVLRPVAMMTVSHSYLVPKESVSMKPSPSARLAITGSLSEPPPGNQARGGNCLLYLRDLGDCRVVPHPKPELGGVRPEVVDERIGGRVVLL